MTSHESISLSLPPEATDVVWRILGNGASPEVEPDAYALIEGVVRKHVSGPLHASVIAEIRAWYTETGDRHWLRSELTDQVARLIADGVGTEFKKDHLWALGALDAGVMRPLLRERWSDPNIERFCDAVLTLVESLCARDLVLDPRALRIRFGADARIPKTEFAGNSTLDRYHLLETRASYLTRDAIHPALAHLVDLCLSLRPDRLAEMVRRADHPLIRLFAADTVYDLQSRRDHRHTLTWISAEASEDLIALAILKTLRTVEELDAEHKDIHHSSFDESRHYWCSELRPPTDLQAAAGSLLLGLVHGLDSLGPHATAKWMAELLAEECIVDMPDRLEQLEQACLTLLQRLLESSDDFDALVTLLLGTLRHPLRGNTNLRHLGALAWSLRHVAPARSKALGHHILTVYIAWLSEEMRKGHFYFNLETKHERRWLLALGIALALTTPQPLAWIRERLADLPLTAWDAEESHQAFSAAQGVVDHLVCAALQAVEQRVSLEQSIPRSEFMQFFELYWAHGRFIAEMGPVFSRQHDIVTELMIRAAARHGELGDSLVLELLRTPRQHPRISVALLDVHPLAPELLSAAIDALAGDFVTRLPKSVEVQYWWARVWLMLAQPQLAYLVLKQTDRSRGDEASRIAQIVFLKLALLVLERFEQLDPELDVSQSDLAQRIHRLYDSLWAYQVDLDHEERSGILARMQRLGLKPVTSP